ncbi:MAG: HlyD family efflux transporter periplasmic adaptor subunit [Phycisphaerales bacterium]
MNAKRSTMSSTSNRPSRTLKTAMVAGLALGAATWSGCTDEADRKAAAKASTGTADRAPARSMGFEIVTTANGELEARKRVEIRNPLDQESAIVRIVPEGTRVTAGDILIQLNVEEIQLKVDEEKLKVESARADAEVAKNAHEIQVKENEIKLRQAKLKLELAELALEQWEQGDRLKKERDLELAADKAVLELHRLAEVYMRAQNLNTEGFMSKNQMDLEEVAYIEAISEYKTSKLALDVYREFEQVKDRKTFESDVAEAAQELDKAELNNRSELASKLAEMNNSREQLLGLERKLAKLTKQRDDATIRAERDGLVVYGTSVDRNSWSGRGGGGGESTLTIGTQVSPNQLLMILPDTSEMLAAVRVHESLAGRIRKDQSVNVRIDAAGGVTFAGRVESVGVMAESGGWRDPNLREYTVRVAIDTQDGTNLKPAMRCEARIILDTVPEAVAIPVQAVFNEGPVQFVYAPVGPRFERVPVRIGRRSDTLAEVVKGLDEGTMVLLREPASGEVLAGNFKPEMLTAAGYRLDDSGKVIAEGGMRPGGPAAGAGVRPTGGPPADRGRRDGRGGEAPASGTSPTPTPSPAAASVPAEGKPAAQTTPAAPSAGR